MPEIKDVSRVYAVKRNMRGFFKATVLCALATVMSLTTSAYSAPTNSTSSADTTTISIQDLQNLPALIKAARSEFPNHCKKVLTAFMHSTRGIGGNSQLIDTYLYIIQNSTQPMCLLGTMAFLNVSMRTKAVKADDQTQQKIGTTLEHVLSDDSFHGEAQRIQTDAAAGILESMGSTYKQAADDFYINHLKHLANTPDVTDVQRQEAIRSIKKLWIWNSTIPAGLLKYADNNMGLQNFWKNSMQKLPPAVQVQENQQLERFKKEVGK